MCPKRAFQVRNVPTTNGTWRGVSGAEGAIATQSRACARARQVGRGPSGAHGIEDPSSGPSRFWTWRSDLDGSRSRKQCRLDGIGGLSLLSGEHVRVDLQRGSDR